MLVAMVRRSLQYDDDVATGSEGGLFYCNDGVLPSECLGIVLT